MKSITGFIIARLVLYWLSRTLFWLAAISSNLVQGMVVGISGVTSNTVCDVVQDSIHPHADSLVWWVRL